MSAGQRKRYEDPSKHMSEAGREAVAQKTRLHNLGRKDSELTKKKKSESAKLARAKKTPEERSEASHKGWITRKERFGKDL